ncbi:streptophobe family protein [Streptomyces coeruleorubidus]|uniref:Streptophobe family protein n=1 Tax=Streptomyces coeruleorubidus TaxID=116188 RepID=A0ABZ0KIK5_STRC4|nr:streptophobe family protein [Streptomyces coeruleorubidus]WOT37825.1 streptophobe family protein [Streptomyces coeruleorubidus]
MSAGTGVGTARDGTRVPWTDVLMSAVAAVSWALIGMAGTAALGLRLLEADTAGSLGPMTAAVVALGAGGSVTPSGDVSAFGLTGAEAETAIEITPLGVSLVGALLLSYFFLRSLRAAGVVISPTELLARAGAVVALFVAMLGGLAWAGHDVITIDGGALGLDDLAGGGGDGLEIPGLGDIGGLLPDRLGDLVDAQAAVGFTVDTAPTLLGGLGWSAGILLIALLASRRTPLPRGWEAVHRVVRPAVSAVVTVLLVAVAAGLAAAAYAATGDDHPRRIAGAALLGAPNGVWLGVPIGLLVPWDGRATGELARLLPDPLDDLLAVRSDQPVTLGRLAELDGRVWLLGVAAALMMLLAGVLTAVRTPVGGGSGGPGDVRGSGALGFAGRCALGLAVATALSLPLLVRLTDVSVTASLSVLGFDAFGAGLELHGHLGMALLLGAVWGAGAGAVGALLAWASGAAGRWATASARGQGVAGGGVAGAGAPGVGGAGNQSGAGWAGDGLGAGPAAAGGGVGQVGYVAGAGQAGPWADTRQAGRDARAGQAVPSADTGQTGSKAGAGQGRAGAGTGQTGPDAGAGRSGVRGGSGVGRASSYGDEAGPYVPGTPYRPPNPATNPYLRVPDELREPEDARPVGEEGPPDGTAEPGRQAGEGRQRGESRRPPHEAGDPAGQRDGDVYGAPTVARPVGPPPRGPRQPPGPKGGNRPPARPDDGPPPPPPPPPPPRKPRGGK